LAGPGIRVPVQHLKQNWNLERHQEAGHPALARPRGRARHSRMDPGQRRDRLRPGGHGVPGQRRGRPGPSRGRRSRAHESDGSLDGRADGEVIISGGDVWVCPPSAALRVLHPEDLIDGTITGAGPLHDLLMDGAATLCLRTHPSGPRRTQPGTAGPVGAGDADWKGRCTPSRRSHRTKSARPPCRIPRQ